jgi:hypothetical protein
MTGINVPRCVLFKAISIPLFLLFPVFGQSGTLNVSSQPTGASVWIDEQEIGSTPLINYMVKAGSHKLQLIEASSNKSIIKTIQIAPDSSLTLEIPLDVSYGNLDVESAPKDAKASLSTNLGTTPLKGARLISGDYTLKIESSNPFYKPLTQTITIPINGTEQVKVELPKNTAHYWKVGTQVILGIAAIISSAFGYVQDDKGNRGICFTVSTICIVVDGVFVFF